MEDEDYHNNNLCKYNLSNIHIVVVGRCGDGRRGYGGYGGDGRRGCCGSMSNVMNE